MKWPAEVVFCGVFPVFVIVSLFLVATQDDAVAKDFRGYYAAAESVLRHESPYISVDDISGVNGSFVYPPLTAVGAVPFTAVPRDVAEYTVMVLLTFGLLAIPLILGVRDWRCYGVALLWPSTIEAIQTGTVTIVLALGAALSWRFRDRVALGSLAAGITVTVKLILWPLLVWLAATRRTAAGALSCLVAVCSVLGAWAIIGFAGLLEYPTVVHRLQALVERDCYTVYAMALDAGASPGVARGMWLSLGLGLLAAVVRSGRRGDERTAFILAIAGALALSPIVWLHYFTLLLVAVCIAQPKLGAAWLAPLGMLVATGSGHPTLVRTAATISAAALTIVLSVLAAKGLPLRSVLFRRGFQETARSGAS